MVVGEKNKTQASTTVAAGNPPVAAESPKITASDTHKDWQDPEFDREDSKAEAEQI